MFCTGQRRKHSHTCDTICRANKIRSKERNEGADGKVTVAFVPEITRYKVICGSNGKVGTRFNTVIIPKEQKGRVIVKETIDNGSVGRKLTDKEFVELYPKQCNIFKEIFKEEYKALTKK